jgi:hypothetical protein
LDKGCSDSGDILIWKKSISDILGPAGYGGEEGGKLNLYREKIYQVPGEKVKVKVKFTLEQATKAQRGSRGIALFFL